MISFTAVFAALRPLIKWVELNVGIDWEIDDHQDGTHTITYIEIETDEEGDQIINKAHELGLRRD